MMIYTYHQTPAQSGPFGKMKGYFYIQKDGNMYVRPSDGKMAFKDIEEVRKLCKELNADS
jgi:hypothetical protein